MSLLTAVQGELVFVEQAENRTVKLFEPFSRSVIEPQLGLSVVDIVQGFKAIRELIGDRLQNGIAKRQPVVEKWKAWRGLSLGGASTDELDAFVRNDPQFESMGRDYYEGTQSIIDLLLFEPSDLEANLNERATNFFEAFSFVPGQINGSYLTPFDDDGVRARPFARVDKGRFMLFDVYYAPLAPLYRLPECFTSELDKQRLTRQRDRSLESDADDLLSPVIGSELKARSYYVPVGANGSLAERDLLLFKDGVLLIVESKAKALRSVAGHRGNLTKLSRDVRVSIQEGYDQACTVLAHLRSNAEIALFDSDKPGRKEIGRLVREQVREAFAVVVLDSYYGLVATDLAPWLTVDPQVGFPWVVDRDTLEVVLMKLESLDKLSSFLRWRKALHGKVSNEDEAVFAGFFVRHGPYVFPPEADLIQLDAEYSDVFEAEWFGRKGMSFDVKDEITKPVMASLRREDGKLIQEIDGKVHDVIDMHTGKSSRDLIEEKRRRRKRLVQRSAKSSSVESPPERLGRNDRCPCGSGKKYKRCCMRTQWRF